MKAILIINTPDDFDYRRCSMGGDGNIYYDREDEQRTSIIGNIKNLKPMPYKKIHIGKYNVWEIEEEDKEMLVENRGYNKCIDEILGEQNERK